MAAIVPITGDAHREQELHLAVERALAQLDDATHESYASGSSTVSHSAKSASASAGH